MTNVLATSWLVGLLATVVLIRIYLLDANKLGRLPALFAPVLGFGLAFVLAFGVRPPFYLEGLLHYHFTAPVEPEVLVLAQMIGLAGFAAFILGDRLVDRVSGVAIPRPVNNAVHSSAELRDSAFVLASLASGAFVVLVYLADGFGIDLALNRANYTEFLAGRGYVYLLNLSAAVFLIIGAMHSVRVKKLGAPGACAISLFVLGNAFVTNRSLLTSLIYGFLVIYLIVGSKSLTRRVVVATILGLGMLIVVGTLLGMLRGTSTYEIRDEPLLPLLFLAMTFDMSEMLHDVLLRFDGYRFGKSWFEDIVFGAIPRSLFPSKPTIFGAVGLQQAYFPGSFPEHGVPTATYPLGIFGEAFVNFGAIGVVLTLFGVGGFVRAVFLYALTGFRERPHQIGHVYSVCVLAFCIANTLGYMRSLGWFLSQLALMAILVPFCVLTVRIGSVRLGSK